MNEPRTIRKTRRINALSVARMMVLMQGGPMSLHDLVAEVGLSIGTVREYVLTLHREGGCHIASWAQDRRGRYTTPQYVSGPGRDARQPKKTVEEINRAYRERQRQLRTLMALAGKANDERRAV